MLIDDSPTKKDVSIQTSSTLGASTNNSSTSSNNISMVQSNTYGSIVARFGSATVQKNQSVAFDSTSSVYF